jgi:2-polyprenyl-3-methyl-5-hydroxy-6-metoxy-1,4-benzoquinol methylase
MPANIFGKIETYKVTMPHKLDSYSAAYQSDSAYYLDNELILNWYPERVLKLAQGNSLLELGIGHGFTPMVFSKNFAKHVVIEGSSEVISLFRSKCDVDKIEIVQTFFESFETQDTFDVIMMGFVLEHVDCPDVILKRYARLLKPNGSIFIAVPNSEALNKRFGYHAGLISDMSELSAADKALGHQRLYTVDSLRALIESNGCFVKTLEGLFLKPITTSQIQQLKLSPEILQAMLKVGVNYPELCVGLLAEVKIAGSLSAVE